MNKQKYLRKLRKALKGVPERDKENLVEYYAELIDDSFERGKTPREVFAELEAPERVADNFKRENDFGGYDYGRRSARRDSAYGAPPPPPYGDPAYNAPPVYGPAYTQAPPPPQYREPSRRERFRERRKGHSPIFWILLSPFLFVFGIVAFSLGIALTVVGLSLLIALFAVIVAFFAGGIYAIAVSFKMFTINPAIAITQVGAGLVLIAFANVFALLVGPACRGYGAFLGWIFRGFRRSNSVKPVRYRSYAGKIATLACSIAVLVVGSVMGVVGFGRLGYDYKKLAVFDDYAERSRSVALEDAARVSVSLGTMSLTVQPAEGDEFRFTWNSAEEGKIQIDAAEGVLSVIDGREERDAFGYFTNVWNRGIAYGPLSYLYNQATLEVPASFGGQLEIDVWNGSVSLSGMELSAAKITTSNSSIKITDCNITSLSAETKNGEVRLSGVTADTAEVNSSNGYVEIAATSCKTLLTAKTSNGMVKADNVSAASVALKTSNGAIEVWKLQSDRIELKTSNGAIFGMIVGAEEDFSIDAATSLGACNLTSREGGSKSLYAHTSCGAINVTFGQGDAQ